MTDKASVSVAAPAKINLALHVCGRRGDGYHLLDSLVVFAGIGDRITARPASDFYLGITGPFAGGLAAEGDNLVLRAARWLAAKTGSSRAAHLSLEKNLPIASGIGGGSSDAAAALIACARIWGANTDSLPHAELAAALGADVPVCLMRHPALMRGIGEDVTLLPSLPAAWLVLANPGLPLATKAVFGALNGRYSGPLEPMPPCADAADLARYLARQHNSLAAPAIERLPVITVVLDALSATAGCLLARLSGSGPTCFGLYGTEAAARSAANALKATHSGWWLAPAPMLTGTA
ncbi:MAG: 4-(cytidine 5'-diphospho)-2-C-methyl-D-erythritol kinase [Rhodospirillaceae bacterium]